MLTKQPCKVQPKLSMLAKRPCSQSDHTNTGNHAHKANHQKSKTCSHTHGVTSSWTRAVFLRVRNSGHGIIKWLKVPCRTHHCNTALSFLVIIKNKSSEVTTQSIIGAQQKHVVGFQTSLHPRVIIDSKENCQSKS